MIPINPWEYVVVALHFYPFVWRFAVTKPDTHTRGIHISLGPLFLQIECPAKDAWTSYYAWKGRVKP